MKARAPGITSRSAQEHHERITMSREKHWEAIYRSKASTEVSWYQPEARLSLELIRRNKPSQVRTTCG
jgi:hypothetical protein